jgi:hypothetical protein
MHNAPPVVYPVGRFVWGLYVMACLSTLGALGLVFWQRLSALPWAVAGWAWVAWGMCVVLAFAWRSGQTLSSGHLFWTGEAWLLHGGQNDEPETSLQWSVAPFVVSVSVLLDLGSVMLLTVQPLDESGQRAGRLRHAWVHRAATPSKWHGFRCAVYSRRKVMRDAATTLSARS